MSSFSRGKKKTLLRVLLCFDCKLSKLPFTTMSRPTTEKYIYNNTSTAWMLAGWLWLCRRYVSVFMSLQQQKKSPWVKDNPVKSGLAQQRSVPWLHVSRFESFFSAEFPWMEKQAMLCGQLTGQKSNNHSSVNSHTHKKTPQRRFKLLREHQTPVFQTQGVICTGI